jgi:hypothetical protein
MRGVLLAAVLLSAPPSRADLEFTNAVEDFVRTVLPTTCPPEPAYWQIKRLGSDCWRCRELAGRRLLEESRTDPRWLMWGRHDTDPEVRLRCNNLLRELARCGPCRGTGVCREFHQDPLQPDDPNCANCGAWGWNHGDRPAVCRPCGGIGSAWAKGGV